MMDFNPHNHYWIHEDGQTVFSSARELEVSVDDKEYQIWKSEDEEEHIPTPYPKDKDGYETVAAMESILIRYSPIIYSSKSSRRASEIHTKLIDLDRQGERSIQELLDPTIGVEDKKFSEDKLIQLNAQKAELRKELSQLDIG